MPKVEIYQYKNKINGSGRFLQREKSLVNLVKKYRTKPIRIISKPNQKSEVICEKLISKQIG